MSQIEVDIERRISDKLGVWMKDSFALCEMANISGTHTAAMVLRTLLFAFVSGVMQKGGNKADLLEVVGTNWDMLLEYKQANKP